MTHEQPNPDGRELWERELRNIDLGGLHGIPSLTDRIVTEIGSPTQNALLTGLKIYMQPFEEYLSDQVVFFTTRDQIPGVTTETEKAGLRVQAKTFRFSVRTDNPEVQKPASLRVAKRGKTWECSEYQEGDEIYRFDDAGRIVGFRTDINHRGKCYTPDYLQRLFGYRPYGNQEIGILDFSFSTADNMKIRGIIPHKSEKKQGKVYEKVAFERTIGEKGELLSEYNRSTDKDSKSIVLWLINESELAYGLFEKRQEGEERDS